MGKERPELEILGTRLRDARLLNNWSLEDVNELFDVKSSVNGAYERGERNISIDRLVALASAYGTTASELLDFGEKQDQRRIPDRRMSAGRRDGEVSMG